MYYVLVDSEGNRLDAFHEEQAAHEALLAMVAEDPDAANDVLLFSYRDDGGREGEALMFADLADSSEPRDRSSIRMGSTIAGAATVDLAAVLSPPPTATVMAGPPLVQSPDVVRAGAMWAPRARVESSTDRMPTPRR